MRILSVQMVLLNNNGVKMANRALVYRRFGQPEEVLHLEAGEKGELAADAIRVTMRYAPVNASDLIPITGAYQHRITLPQVAGYEGMGVVTDAPAAYRHLMGRRVLALRGEGTLQSRVDIPAALAIPVPDNIDDKLAARGYINPFAAKLMLEHFSPAGKDILITAAGSECAMLLGQWALRAGARSVTGIHRSPVHALKLEQYGITPVQENESEAIGYYAARAGVVYDATGGRLAEKLLALMPLTALFISYGLLSGEVFRAKHPLPKIHWFHVRHYLAAAGIHGWQQIFKDLWPLLAESYTHDARIFTLDEWKAAIEAYRTAGRTAKPLVKLDP